MRYSRRSAIYVLIDKKGRILLQLRDSGTNRFPGYWGLFGGLIEKDETPEEAVRREALEELQIELNNLKFFKKYQLEIDKGVYEEAFVFTAPLLFSINGLKKQQKEGRDLGLYSAEEWKNLKTPEFEEIIFRDIFKNGLTLIR